MDDAGGSGAVVVVVVAVVVIVVKDVERVRLWLFPVAAPATAVAIAEETPPITAAVVVVDVVGGALA